MVASSQTESTYSAKTAALAALRQEIPDWDERVAREGQQQRVKEAPELKEHRRPTKEEQDKGVHNTLNRGSTNADYLTARIKRDAPEIAARLEQGEFKSVRAAAIEAGIVKQHSSMEAIRQRTVTRRHSAIPKR